MCVRQSAIAAVLAVFLSGCAHRAHIPPQHDVVSTKDDWSTSVVAPSASTRDPHAWGTPTVVRAEAPDADLPPAPQAVADDDDSYLLDTGDQLRIFVYGQPNLSRLYTVDHRGFIMMPLIGKVRARRLTTYALAHKLKHRLGVEYVRDPQVTVDINQNRPFFVMGEVRNPGQFPYVSGMTMKTAVAIAGGYSERAKKGYGRVSRRINGVVEVLDVPSDYVIKPGDTVEIFERFF